MKTFIITLLCVIHVFTVNAQAAFKCAGVNYIIPGFKADTVKKLLWEKQFEDLGILQPIEHSKCDIELRMYYDVVSIGSGSAIIIKGNADKVFAAAYYYRYQRGANDSIPPPGFKAVKHGKRNVYYSVKTLQVPDTLLGALIKHKLFNRQDAFALRDSLQKQGIQVEQSHALDPFSLTFTLKVKDHIRRFDGYPAYFYVNKTIKEFSYDVLLFNDFDNLYNGSGQERNHLFP